MAEKFSYSYIGSPEIKQCLEANISQLMDTIENCFRNFSAGSEGGVVQPVRGIVQIKENNGALLSMPAYSKKDSALATKIVTFFPENKKLGKPTITATVLLFDHSTGFLKCMLDGKDITNYRTAAASAVATKYLAPEKVDILAILGAGNQARSHCKLLTYLYKFKEIRVWNHNEETGYNLVEEINRAGLPGRFCSSVEETVKDADIIVTVTSSRKPLVEKEWVKPGAHINAVGAPLPEWQELSSELVKSSVVYVDSREGALAESGDIIISKAPIYAEIGEVILGTHQAHRNKTTIFKSLGMAVEDVVTASLIYEQLKNKV